MNHEESTAYQELTAVLQSERFKALRRVKEIEIPDRLDLLLLAQWRAELAVSKLNPRTYVRMYGLHWGAGAGGFGVVIALIEMLVRLLGGG